MGRGAASPRPTEPALPVPRTVEAMRALRRRLAEEGRRVGLVPTMGYLHEGHLSLVDVARRHADAVVLSVFVNPTQFGPVEDFDSYPRDLERDVERAAARGAVAVFAPTVQEMYPVEQSVWVEPGPLADHLCGRSRPWHFRGVLTVVAKLFSIVRPQVAAFGRKDYQQAVLIRRMVRELHLPVRVETAPIVRDADGLALSSRNAHLAPEERQVALSLSAGLRAARQAFAAGERDRARLERLARCSMEEAGAEVEYAAVVDPETLEPAARGSAEVVCAVAARVGGTRLIDNVTLGGPSSLDGSVET